MSAEDLFAVGVLYDIQELSGLLGHGRIVPADIIDGKSHTKYGGFRVSAPGAAKTTLVRLGWAAVNSDGSVALSTQLRELTALNSASARLRWQLLEILMKAPPPWAGLLRYGRAEALTYVRPNVLQCFDEAGLLTGDDPAAASWWARVTGLFHEFHNSELAITGYEGEVLSRGYESERTGVKPAWQSIDSARSGFDLLSRISREDSTRLLIEVKASGSSAQAANFFLSRNEWNVARRAPHYYFHLWSLADMALYVVPAAVVANHVPGDRGKGYWDAVRLRFSTFAGFKAVLPDGWAELAKSWLDAGREDIPLRGFDQGIKSQERSAATVATLP